MVVPLSLPLLVQTPRTARRQARHSVHVLNMKYLLEFVFIEHYAMLFCQFKKWMHARMPGRV